MSKTVEIPGGTAVLREASEMRVRDRNLVKAYAMAASSAIQKLPAELQDTRREGETEEEHTARRNALAASVDLEPRESMAMLELHQATVVASLESWTRPEPLPTMDTFGDLPADLGDALIEAIGGAVGAVSVAETDFSPVPDLTADTPTDGSGPSEQPSVAGPEPTSTPALSSAGESSSTAPASVG